MFQSMSSLMKATKSSRERTHALLLQDKKAFESTMHYGALCSDNKNYQPEVAKMYRRLIARIAQSEQLLIVMRKVSTIG